MRRGFDTGNDGNDVRRPSALPIRLDGIPNALKAHTAWVCWDYKLDDQRWAKPPFSPHTGGFADVKNPATWGTMEEACAACMTNGWDGIGFVLTKDAGLVAIDVDDCRDPVSGALTNEAASVVARIPSYFEVSPSGAGIRGIAKGDLPGARRRRGHVEMYDDARYVTVTGHHLANTSRAVTACQRELDAFYRETFGGDRARVPAARPGGTFDRSDRAIVGQAERAANGRKFRRLMAGDWQGLGYPSKSEADCALVEFLYFWGANGDAQIDRLFRLSALTDDKWANRPDYREDTMAKAREMAIEARRTHVARKGRLR